MMKSIQTPLCTPTEMADAWIDVDGITSTQSGPGMDPITDMMYCFDVNDVFTCYLQETNSTENGCPCHFTEAMIGTHTVFFPIISDTHEGQTDYMADGGGPPPIIFIFEVFSPCYFDQWKFNEIPHPFFFVYAVDQTVDFYPALRSHSTFFAENGCGVIVADWTTEKWNEDYLPLMEVYKANSGASYSSGELRGYGIAYSIPAPSSDHFEFEVIQSCTFAWFVNVSWSENVWKCGIQLTLKIKDLGMVTNDDHEDFIYQPTMFFLDATVDTFTYTFEQEMNLVSCKNAAQISFQGATTVEMTIPQPDEYIEVNMQIEFEFDTGTSPSEVFMTENNEQWIQGCLRTNTISVACAWSIDNVVPYSEVTACTDLPGVDSQGNVCSYYTTNPNDCSIYDDTFVAGENCCACNGGQDRMVQTSSEYNLEFPQIYTDTRIVGELELSDETPIAGQTWSTYKSTALAEGFALQSSSNGLTQYEKCLVNALISAQNTQGDTLALPQTPYERCFTYQTTIFAGVIPYVPDQIFDFFLSCSIENQASQGLSYENNSELTQEDVTVLTNVGYTRGAVDMAISPYVVTLVQKCRIESFNRAVIDTTERQLMIDTPYNNVMGINNQGPIFEDFQIVNTVDVCQSMDWSALYETKYYMMTQEQYDEMLDDNTLVSVSQGYDWADYKDQGAMVDSNFMTNGLVTGLLDDEKIYFDALYEAQTNQGNNNLLRRTPFRSFWGSEMTLTPSKYDLQHEAFEGFQAANVEESPTLDVSVLDQIILDLPAVSESEQKVHFFVVDRTLSGPDVNLVQEVTFQYYCPEFNSDIFIGTSDSHSIDYFIDSDPVTIDYEQIILENCLNEGWQAIELLSAVRRSADNHDGVSLSEADLVAMGIDVNLQESTLTIESHDLSLSDTWVEVTIRRYIITDESFQVYTVIAVSFFEPDCQLTQDGVLNRLGGEEMMISLIATQATSEDESEYGTFIARAENAFQVNSQERVYCGDMVMTINSADYSFLIFDEDTQTVTLQPTIFNEAGVFSESTIVFTMDRAPNLSISLTIESTIERCTVNLVSFTNSALQIEYLIGDDSSNQLLPDVIQEPACNAPIESYSFVGSSSVLTSSQIEEMIEIDQYTRSVRTYTQDFSILGENITLEIHPHSSLFDETTTTQPLILTIRIITNGPSFVEMPTANDLHCNQQDSDWEMILPEVKFQELLNAQVFLDRDFPPNRIFVIDDDMVVRLNPSIKQKFIEGEACPSNGQYEIQFRIDSQAAGVNYPIAQVNIDSNVLKENRLRDNWISDQTTVAEVAWKDLKQAVLDGLFQQTSQFVSIMSNHQSLHLLLVIAY